MKRHSLTVAAVIALASAFTLPSCIGSFALTNRLLSWNNSISNKFVNELVFIAFWVLPVYEVSGLADLLVINSIEFWSGDNPMACGEKRIEGTDGQTYLVKCDGKGYDIVSESDGSNVRLDFDIDEQMWSVTLPSGESHELFTYVDADHVSMPAADGSRTIVELSQDGVMAYRSAVSAPAFAMAH